LSSHSPHETYRRDIDGLRAIAVLSVVLFHAFPGLVPGGFIGVDVFFVISGYLISGKMLEDLHGQGFSYTDFYGRRIRRLFPSLLTVLATCLGLGWFMLLPNEYELLGKHTAAGLAFVANVALWREAANYFNAEVDTRPLLHLWSLGIEEQFYMVWPPVLFMVWKVRRHLVSILCVLMLASLLWGVTLLARHDTVSAFYLPWARFWELFAGGLLAYLVRHRPDALNALPVDRQALGLVLLCPALWVLNEKLPFPGWLALIPVVGAFLILSGPGAGRPATGVSSWLGHPWLVGFGLISYPLYLWHWPVLSFARIWHGETPPIEVRVAGVAFSVLLAWATYRWIEKPLRFHTQRRKVTVVLCGVAVVMLTAGGVLWKTNWVAHRAIAERFPDFDKTFNQTRFSDGSCERLLGRSALPEEVCLTNSAAPEYLFIGDSHAMALNSAAHLGWAPMKSMLVGAHSCMLYPNVRHRPKYQANYAHNCQAIAKQAIAAALNTASVHTVVVVQSTPVFSEAQGVVSFDYQDEASGQSISQYEAFMRGNFALLQALKQSHKRIVFVKDTHYLNRNPLDCVNRWGTTADDRCAVPAEQVKRTKAAYGGALTALMATSPHVRLYDASAVLCDESVCRANEGNRFYFFDTHHLSGFGSAKVLADFRLSAALQP